jgi:hypothetical protein
MVLEFYQNEIISTMYFITNTLFQNMIGSDKNLVISSVPFTRQCRIFENEYLFFFFFY